MSVLYTVSSHTATTTLQDRPDGPVIWLSLP